MGRAYARRRPGRFSRPGTVASAGVPTGTGRGFRLCALLNMTAVKVCPKVCPAGPCLRRVRPSRWMRGGPAPFRAGMPAGEPSTSGAGHNMGTRRRCAPCIGLILLLQLGLAGCGPPGVPLSSEAPSPPASSVAASEPPTDGPTKSDEPPSDGPTKSDEPPSDGPTKSDEPPPDAACTSPTAVSGTTPAPPCITCPTPGPDGTAAWCVTCPPPGQDGAPAWCVTCPPSGPGGTTATCVTCPPVGTGGTPAPCVTGTGLKPEACASPRTTPTLGASPAETLGVTQSPTASPCAS